MAAYRGGHASTRAGEALLLQGRSLAQQNRHAEALEVYGQFARKYSGPPPVDVMYEVALSMIAIDRYIDAVQMLKALISLKDTPEAWYLLGMAHQGVSHFSDALYAYQESAKRGFTGHGLSLNMGVCQHCLGDFDQAAQFAKEAFDLSSGDPIALRNQILALAASGRTEEALALDVGADLALNQIRLMMLSYLDSVDPIRVKHAHQFVAALYPRPLPPLPPVRLGAGEKLRLGFVSGDFRKHPVSFFFVGLLQAIDREKFEVTLYSTLPGRDEITEQLRSVSGTRWIDLGGQSNELMAQTIRADGIHIAFDLSGTTSAGTPGVFAMRVAPIQVSYIAYALSSGLPEMDYFITDSLLDPPGQNEAHYSEKLLRIEPSFVSYSPFGAMAEVSPLPMLASGVPTFGSFTQLSKLSPATLRLWVDALNAVPQARLFLMCKGLGSFATQERLLCSLEKAGVSRKRVTLKAEEGLASYLAAHHMIDILLETVPWNAHTTAMHGLWMGVPTVTVRGSHHVARFGEMILHHMNLPSFIAPGYSAYGETVRAAVSDPERLSLIRSSCRAVLAKSPLCDHVRVARCLEKLCFEMLQRDRSV